MIYFIRQKIVYKLTLEFHKIWDIINKFNIKEFQKLEKLEDILRKGNRWRLGLVWICGILFILYCGGYDKVEWLANMKYPWSLLLLFASLFIDIVSIPGKCPVCKRIKKAKPFLRIFPKTEDLLVKTLPMVACEVAR